MKTKMMSEQFRKGHIYFSMTQSGRIRKFEVTQILVSETTKERKAVKAIYDGKPEKVYYIEKGMNGSEYVVADNRFCTIVDTLEIIDNMLVIKDDMVSNIHEFNNCGDCIVTVDGVAYNVKWNHGTVEADETIKEAFEDWMVS